MVDHNVSIANLAPLAPVLLEMAAADLCRLDTIATRLRPRAGDVSEKEIHQRLIRELLAAATGGDRRGPLAEVRNGLLEQAAVATRRWLKQIAKKETEDRSRARGGRRPAPDREEALRDLVEDETIAGSCLGLHHLRHRARSESAPVAPRLRASWGGRP